MAYHNRKQQLITTLQTISYSNYKAFEVIIVDDASDDNERLEDIVYKYPFKIILIRINKEEKNHKNPCVPYNIGFKHASGEIIIIQNPECCHIGDVISYVNDTLTENDYFTFTCFGIQSFNENQHLNKILFSETDQNNFWARNKYDTLYNKYLCSTALQSDKGRWYNDSVYWACNLHFLSAIYKTQLDKIGGFDERYKDGMAYEDTIFVLRIRNQLKLKVKLVEMIEQNTYHLCIHQYHKPTDYKNNMALCKINERLYEIDLEIYKK